MDDNRVTGNGMICGGGIGGSTDIPGGGWSNLVLGSCLKPGGGSSMFTGNSEGG